MPLIKEQLPLDVGLEASNRSAVYETARATKQAG